MAEWILGIETSCDETSAAVLRGATAGVRARAGSSILSQDVHRIFGGVVPELASRAHVRTIGSVVDRALADAGIGLGQLDGDRGDRGSRTGRRAARRRDVRQDARASASTGRSSA